MVTLAKSFSRSGFAFTQLQREGRIAVYHKQRVGGKAQSWEVIRIGSHDGKTIEGRYIEPAETYPSSEMWGTDGFTLYSPQDALNRAVQLKEQLRSG